MTDENIIKHITTGILGMFIYVGLSNVCTLLKGYIDTCENIYQVFYGPVSPIPTHSPYLGYNSLTQSFVSGPSGPAGSAVSPSPSLGPSEFDY